MKKQNKQKGITLVALVVTIIILLILAGISIASLTGNGLFEKAKLAKEKQINAESLENTTLADYENKIDEYIKSNREEHSQNSNFVELTSTFSSNIARFSYPDGYNKGNTYVIAARAFRPGQDMWTTRMVYSYAMCDDVIGSDDECIWWSVNTPGISYSEAKILIIKVD